MTKMVEKNRILVVVSVLEGKRFPRRPKHKLVAEAKFDGELLSTDPIDHVETPDFTQELAWELDKKGLQQHKLQRTSIKIQCYAVDTQTTMKEAIGYVVLDLRSAQNKQQSKYYPLLQSKYHKTKPEVKLSLYLDEDKTEKPQVNGQASAKTGFSPKSGVDLKLLKPILNEAEGFYQLGPESTCRDHFLLSVTIANATNLMQLIPSASSLPPTADGYFFYYSFFGNDVTNEPFHDLINPNFPAERASVRIQSKVDVLRMFLTKQPGIQVHLCCGEQSLGSCEVPLTSLLKKDSTEIYMKPVSIEGLFELLPPNKAKQQSVSQPGNLSPAVGLSVVLRKEDTSVRTPVKDKQPGITREKTPSPARSPHSKSPKQQLPKPKIQTKPVQDGNYSDTFEESEENGIQEQKALRTPERPHKVTAQESSELAQGVSNGSSSTTQHHLAIPAQAHHFTFSIDLRSVKDIQSIHPLNVFLRYTYQFFGSAAPIVTHPPVEIKKGMEVLLPQSFCAFDFACTLQQLQDTFNRVPLLVEVWNRDRQLSKDSLIGSAKLPLEQMATVERVRAVSNDGRSGWRQAYSDKIPVSSCDGNKSKCAEVTMVLNLEDWGPINSQEIATQQQVQPNRSASPVMPFLSDMIAEEPRQTTEYQTAMEIELWKEQQEQAFENQLKQKEVLYMKALAEEWKKRDKERELLMKKKLAEYAQLEEQLRKTLADLEKKQKQQSANEQEVVRLRTDLQREHDKKLQEMKEASRRMKEDCDHQVGLQKNKTKELEELLQRYKQEYPYFVNSLAKLFICSEIGDDIFKHYLTRVCNEFTGTTGYDRFTTFDAEKKYKNLEREFNTYKEQQHSKPEVRLQSEINLLTLEKVEVERKLDASTKSKIHYKQQWGRALKELARLKQREQEVAKVQLKRQQQELEHMRLRYLAAEEKEVVQSEKKELEDIKNELNKLKQLSEEDKNKQESYDKHMNHSKHLDDLKGPKSGLGSNLEEHITRLIEERDTLLRTGVYSTQDRIIAELDKQIRECIAQKKS